MNDDPSSTKAAIAGAVVATEAPVAARDGGSGAGFLGRIAERLKLRRPSLREDLATALSAEVDSGHSFTPEERMLLQNILRLREVRVEDVMVPRADIVAVDRGVRLKDLIVAFRTSGHSRMPIYGETLDDPIGMVHIKDLMSFIAVSAGSDHDLDLARVDLERPLTETGLVRPVLFVPPSMPAPDLMAKMRAARVQMALVIDEYGGTDGLVSLEDLVETVIGDIEDEHDDEEDEATIKATGDGVWVADTRVDLDTVAAAIGEAWDLGPLAQEVDTLGGLVFALLGRIPVRGELISPKALPGYEFEVLDADPRRIRKLRLFRRTAEGRGGDGRRRKERREAASPPVAVEA